MDSDGPLKRDDEMSRSSVYTVTNVSIPSWEYE